MRFHLLHSFLAVCFVVSSVISSCRLSLPFVSSPLSPCRLYLRMYRVYRQSRTLPEIWDPPKSHLCHHLRFFPRIFDVLVFRKRRVSRKGRERRRGGGECGDGVLTFWIVNGRLTSRAEVKSDWTATCVHDSHLSLNTSLKKRRFTAVLWSFLLSRTLLLARS